MRFKQVGNKEDLIAVVIKNNDTVQINAGYPVVLSMDGAGVDVVLSSTAASAALTWSLRYGVALKNIAVGAYGEAIVFGFVNALAFTSQTRTVSGANSASNFGAANWASQPALSIGQYLTVDTVNNGFITMPTSIGFVTPSTIVGSSATVSLPTGTFSLFNPFAVVGQTLASYSSSASATTDTRSAITASINAFVRMM